jgi:hypothetical protein
MSHYGYNDKNRSWRSERPDRNLRTLSQVAHMASSLAKQLTGRDRDLAYRIKAAACSALIVGGAARLNGVRANSILGLDILIDLQSSLHVPLSHLDPQAQALARSQAKSTRTVAPLSECLNPEQLQSLKGHLAPKTNRAV